MLAKDVDDNQVWFRQTTGLNVRSEYIPLLVGTVTSTALILVLIVAYILWRFCISVEKKEPTETTHIATIEKNLSNNSSYSTLFLDSKNGNSSASRIVELIPEYDNSLGWFYKNHTFSQVSHHDHDAKPPPLPSRRDSLEGIRIKKHIPKDTMSPRNHSVILSPAASLEDYSLPVISEFCAHPCLYKSNSILDDSFSPRSHINFRTRSLPSCVKHKKHSLAGADSVIELYDKVNFSKKRKNRMRNDEAAIIALSKSQSQFFNKDTDILVDNEAVIVYDERTAL